MLPSRCFLFTFVLSYGRFFKTLFKLVSFSKKTYCLLGIYHSCMKGRRPSYSDATSFDMFRHVRTGLHRFCLSFKDISQLFIFFLDFFSLIFFSCMYLCKLFFSSRLHSCFFSIHTAQNCFSLFILFHDCTTFVFFSYVLGSVIIIDWLVVGDFLFFLSLKVFCLLGNMLSF